MIPEEPNIQVVASNDEQGRLPAGTRLLNGQYTIERYLSSGGFGITYLARDSLDRPVVIKECYPEALCARENKTVMARTSAYLGEFQSLVSMFVREARSLAKLRHPNIVGVHQVFEDNATAYMALDLIEGQDLLTMLESREQILSPGKITKLLLKLLDAIATVHDQDMLHRDISPDNILVDIWGNPVLIDFGAAREQASKKSRAISAFLVVKDGYSPQEFYISGSRQGPNSDLYSLAATFYHLITGEAPPNSQSRLAAVAANKPDPCVPLAQCSERYAPEFTAAIDRAMSLFPDDRIQSAKDWVAMIDPEKRRALRQEAIKDSSELRHVIAEMVVEVEEGIAQTIAVQKQTVAPEPVEKVIEYLLPEEPMEPANVPKKKSNSLWQSLTGNLPSLPTKADFQLMLHDRRFGTFVLVSALTFNIYDDPQDNIATNAGPELQKLVALSREFSAKTAELIGTSL